MKRVKSSLGDLQLVSETPECVTAVGVDEIEDPVLEKTVMRIGFCLRSEGLHAVRRQIEVGRHINAVLADAQHGDAAVDRIAKRLDVNAKRLYRMATRADRFTDEQIEVAVKSSRDRKYNLSVSILDELTSVHDDSKRNGLLVNCIEGRWSVSRLRREVRLVVRPKAVSRRAKTGLARVSASAETLKQALVKLTEEGIATSWFDEDGKRAFIALDELVKVIGGVVRQLRDDARATIETAPTSEPQDGEELD